MKRRYFIASVAVTCVLAYYLILGGSKIMEGNQIIHEINIYKVKYGKFPDNLEAVGKGQDIYYGPFYYENKGKYFILYYGASLGESVTYDSRNGEWS